MRHIKPDYLLRGCLLLVDKTSNESVSWTKDKRIPVGGKKQVCHMVCVFSSQQDSLIFFFKRNLYKRVHCYLHTAEDGRLCLDVCRPGNISHLCVPTESTGPAKVVRAGNPPKARRGGKVIFSVFVLTINVVRILTMRFASFVQGGEYRKKNHQPIKSQDNYNRL